jgi:hypothetical protein
MPMRTTGGQVGPERQFVDANGLLWRVFEPMFRHDRRVHPSLVFESADWFAAYAHSRELARNDLRDDELAQLSNRSLNPASRRAEDERLPNIYGFYWPCLDGSSS